MNIITHDEPAWGHRSASVQDELGEAVAIFYGKDCEANAKAFVAGLLVQQLPPRVWMTVLAFQNTTWGVVLADQSGGRNGAAHADELADAIRAAYKDAGIEVPA